MTAGRRGSTSGAGRQPSSSSSITVKNLHHPHTRRHYSLNTCPAVAKLGRGGHVSPHRAASVTTSCMAGLVLASRRPT